MNATPDNNEADLPQTASVSIPVGDDVADRPAGPNRVVPPPPPPPGGTTQGVPPAEWGLPRSVFGDSPPTREWPVPPVSATPPRPTANAPHTGIYGRSNLAPPPASPAEVPPLQRRRGWWVVASVVAVLALAASSFAAGTIVNNGSDSSSQASDQPIVMPAGETDLTPAITLPDVAGPLANGGTSNEPVADVARVVAPSVVLIATDLGQGSGIVWDAANGYILTNNHVAVGSTVVRVTFADGAIVDGDVIGGDARRDVAVIKVDPVGLDLVQAVFAPAHTVEVGQLAVAIGSPFGLEQTVTAGIVSAIGRVNRQAGSDINDQGRVSMIQTDAPINPGNSGGALADREGRVIGMNTSIRTDGQTEGNIGVGFAVPSETVDLIARRIVAGESLDFGFLGISGRTPIDGDHGANVEEVVADSPADLAGLEVGDRIMSVDGEWIRSMDELAAQIQLYRPGDTAVLMVSRDGAQLDLSVVLGSK